MLNCTGPPLTTSASDRALVTAANTPSRSPGPRVSKRTTVILRVRAAASIALRVAGASTGGETRTATRESLGTLEQRQLLPRNLGTDILRQPGNVAAGVRDVRDEPSPDGIENVN